MVTHRRKRKVLLHDTTTATATNHVTSTSTAADVIEIDSSSRISSSDKIDEDEIKSVVWYYYL